jgi:hypothetical protein
LNALVCACGETESTTDNIRGQASANNNLGAVELQLKNPSAAEAHIQKAIALGEQMLAKLSKGEGADAADSAEKTQLQRTISDRKGNLAVLYLNQNNFAAAWPLLEKLLADDLQSGYVMGCVVKQGIQGHYYLKQGEFKEAEKKFKSALDFICRRDDSLYDSHWNAAEVAAAEQVALFNLACLKQQEKKTSEAEALYLQCLAKFDSMHLATVNSALVGLRSLYTEMKFSNRVDLIDKLADATGFKLSGAGTGGGSVEPKRVVFMIDYSGSMSGAKIRTAVDSLRSIFTDHIHDDDSCMLLHFSNAVTVDFPLQVKRNDESASMMLGQINSLTSPSGGTALYDCIKEGMDALNASRTGNDWIVAITDGEDQASRRITLSGLMTG